MDLVLETPWGQRYKIAPLNFEQYARQFEPHNYAEHKVSSSAYEHWKMTHDYTELSYFSLDELAASSLFFVGTPEEFESQENSNDHEEN